MCPTHVPRARRPSRDAQAQTRTCTNLTLACIRLALAAATAHTPQPPPDLTSTTPSVGRRGGEQMPQSREIPVENRGTKSQGRVGQSVLSKVGGWTSPTLLAPRRRPMSQVSLPLSVGTPDLQRALSAPKWPCGQPSVRRGTERSQRQGSTSGAVVNGRPMLLVLIQVRAALAHLGLLGGALNLGPVVEVRSYVPMRNGTTTGFQIRIWTIRSTR